MSGDRRRKRPSGSAEMEIRAAQRRRTPGYTVVKDWVPACVSAPAGKLYHFYRMHLNHKRDDGLVWPTMETAAVYLGLSRGDKVTPYMDELEAVGAIDATRQGQEDGRYLVLVYEDPPDDFDGPVTLVEWYQVNRAELDRRREAAKTKRAARKVKAAGPGDTPKTGDPADTPETGFPDTPPTGEPDTPSTGREPIRTRTNTNRTTPPSSTPDGPDAHEPAGHSEEEGSLSPEDEHLTQARTILEEVQIDGLARRGRAVRGSRLDDLTQQVATRLAAGWPPADATDALRGPLDTVESVYGTLKWRITHQLAGNPPAPAEPRQTVGATANGRPPWCGECESDSYRWVSTDGHHSPLAPCPRCSTNRRRLVTVG